MMKSLIKGFCISLTLVLLLALVGCRSQAKNVKTENVPPASTEEEVISQTLTDSEIEGLTAQARAAGALNPIFFDFNDYNLKPADETNLEKTAAWLSKNPTVRIKIEGNCDERGTSEYNLALGERRANSAKEYLVKLGVRANQIETISWGKEKPFDPGHNEAAWAKNRRDDFMIVNPERT